jgi:hypothetical protein
MATKTISLELDAYEKLKSAKFGEMESFSSVVRRALFGAAPNTAGAVLEGLSAMGNGSIPSKQVLDHWARMNREDQAQPRVSRSKWDEQRAS